MRRLLILAALPLAACGVSSADTPGIPGSGSGPARTFAVKDFTAVEVAGPDSVQVATGNRFSVRAEGDPKMLDRLRIVREGDLLKVGRERGVYTSGTTTKVFVTMPRVTGGRVSGSGDLLIDRVDGDRFDGAVAGSGDLTVRAIKVGVLSASTAGSGDTALAGTARSLKVEVAGSGSVDARHLAAGEATVDVAGSGSVRADVRGPAKVSLAGAGDVDLGDAARCTVAKMGSGSVRCAR